ncbi:MAG TPA: hypothetical protein PKK69_10015 [Ferruginibacter sp.]|nr:hypothetical protein [Ferruginibacter sp.]
MRIPGFIANKYTVSILILAGLLGMDVILHRGMSRVILPKSFLAHLEPANIEPRASILNVTDKSWYWGIDRLDLLGKIPAQAPGIELDCYWDSVQNCFFVYHDTDHISNLRADSLLTAYRSRNKNGAVWFDCKNLSERTCTSALSEWMRLQRMFFLQEKMIVESDCLPCLKAIGDSGVYTSYYVPYFNPYQLEEDSLNQLLRSLSSQLKEMPTAAVSVYYFQYPVLRQFLPRYPVLTWSTESNVSVVSLYFNHQLKADSLVKVILYRPE